MLISQYQRRRSGKYDLEMCRWMAGNGMRRADHRYDPGIANVHPDTYRAGWAADQERDRFWRAFNATRERERREAFDARIAHGLECYRQPFYSAEREKTEEKRMAVTRAEERDAARAEERRIARERKLMAAWMRAFPHVEWLETAEA